MLIKVNETPSRRGVEQVRRDRQRMNAGGVENGGRPAEGTT